MAPRISSTSGAPDLTVEPKLLPDDIKNMDDATLDATIEKLRGDRTLYIAQREARQPQTAVEKARKNARQDIL